MRNSLTCERVVETIEKDKIVLNGFKPERVKAVLPFTPVVYAPICSACVKPAHFQEFQTFVESGLVVPVLIGSYSFYEEALRNFLLSHNHVSVQEFNAFRYLNRTSRGISTLCAHCLNIRLDKLAKGFVDRKGEERQKEMLRRFIGNMDPIHESDAELIEKGFKAYAAGDADRLRKLLRMSAVIEDFRIGEDLHSPIVLDDSDLTELPADLTPEIDEGRSQAARIEAMVTKGLGIAIPTDLPAESYIELVKDYQPEISKTINAVLGTPIATASVTDASKSIIAINNELERIKGSRRYAVLEACMGFYRSNSMLIGAALISGALGYAGSLAGCLGTGVAALGGRVAKRKGWLQPKSRATERMKRIISRDLLPVTNLAMKAYYGSKSPAINVLSLRRRLMTKKESGSSPKAA